MKFQIGDRICMTDNYCSAVCGDEGEIIYMPEFDGDEYGVRFDVAKNGFHACGGRCDNNHGHWILDSYMKLVSSPIDIDFSADDIISLL